MTPSAEPRQLVLELEHRQALGAEDLLVSASNAAAVGLIDAWPAWAHQAALIAGPQGAGKTHLANVWCLRAAARTIAAGALTDVFVGALPAEAAVVVEGIDQGAIEEQAVFHLLNLARERRLSVLITSRTAPGDIPIGLPDLRSRLRSLPVATIEPPDDALLHAVLVKLFADRQLDVEPQVIEYLAVRMERSLAVAARLVEAADQLSLAMRRRVTRPIAAAALDALRAGESASGDLS